MPDQLQPEEEGFQVPIEFVFPETPMTRFADYMLVQHTEYEFAISFFESERPVLLGGPEENREVLNNLKSIKAYCVARVVISAGRMPIIVKALQENLARYQAKQCEAKE
jgi:hypothetical protein